MNIVYLISGNIYVNSSANIRNIAIIKGLEQNGHNVEVFSIDDNKRRDECFIEVLQNSKVHLLYSHSKTNVNDIKHNNQLRIFLKKYANKLYKHIQVYDPYKLKAIHYNDKYINWKKYELCITSSDPKSSHLMGYKAKIANPSIIWVQYWGDPMTLDLTFNSWVRPLIKREELKLFRDADLVLFTNSFTTQTMKEKYPQFKNRFADIPTSFYMTDYDFTKKSFNKDIIHIGYYGGCSRINRNILPLLNVVKNNKKYSITLAGGNDYGLVSKDNITIYDRVCSDTIHRLIEKTDVLVVLENLPKNRNVNSPCRQVPGKMYHYSVTGCPILVICETESLRHLFDRYNNYYFCNNNEKSILKTLDQICKDINKGYSYDVRDEFLPGEEAKKLMYCVESMAKGGK